MNLSSLQLIIFDLDGTLVNSVPDLTDALNIVLKLPKNNYFNEVEVKKMVGSGIRKLLEDAIKKVEYKGCIEQLLIDFKTQYNNNLVNKTTPYEGVVETLKNIPSHIKKAVLSNKLDPFTKKVIQGVNLENHFDLILGANIDIYKSKPSPEGIEYILNSLNIKPENTLMIGDSTHDIHAGQKANITTCAVTYGYRSRDILEKENPNFIIDNLTEIIELIKK